MDRPQIPYQRPTSLVRVGGDRVVLRIRSSTGERMAAPLRPMTLRDARDAPLFLRRP
jgi:hypothetical protein